MQNSPARSGIDVGSVIADTYTIEALIGRGGMGAVFLASHKRLPGKKVAIKVLHAEMSGEEVLARFKREAEIASRLGHPNIVQVHDYNMMPDGTPYVVLEYLHGESLAQRLKRGAMSLDEMRSIVRQVGSALAAAHREGIVHRDLKPQNIFLVPTEVDGRGVEIAKVLDFGISKIRGSTTVKTQDSALLGTPQYMAPEQATGQHKSVDERTDVFAFGAIVYEMLSGHPTFTGETIPEVVFKVVYEEPVPLGQHVPSLPENVTHAVHRALAKTAGDRYSDVGSFVEALTGEPLPTTRSRASLPPLEVDSPTGRTPNSGKEAFAQTMGSGDHAPAGAPASEPTRDVRGSAATIDSQARSPDLGTAGTITADRSLAHDAAPRSPRRAAWIAAAVLAGASIAAATMYLVMRERGDAAVAQGTGQTPQVGSQVGHAAVADAAIIVEPPTPPVAEQTPPPAVDAGRVETDARSELAAKPSKQERKSTSKPARTDTDEVAGGDEGAAEKLRQAQAAFEAGAWDRAETFANAVRLSPDAVPRQKLRATLLYGMVQCKGRNDEGRAIVALRALGKSSKLRATLLRVCHESEYLLGIPR